MTRSIRKFLLVNLLLSLAFVTGLTLFGSLLLEHKDIERHTDAELVSAALVFHAMLTHSNVIDFNKMQQAIDAIPDTYNKLLAQRGDDIPKIIPHSSQFQFQVWNDEGKLLLRSRSAPSLPLSSGEQGFSRKVVNGQSWRVYTTYDAKSGLSIVVAISYVMRNKLEQRLTQDYLFIALLTAPLLGLLIWIIVGKGLNIIIRVAEELSNRAPSYLEPVDLHSVPTEIEPLVDELNHLFLRLQQAFDREKRFAADAAHELRTPLAALKTQAQVARQATTDIERQTALNNLLAGVDRCTHIIQQLLTLSRMVPEASLENPKPVDLVHIAKEVLSLLVPSALEKSIEIELNAPEHPVFIKGNATALSILLRNLVDNAIRYTPAKTKVTTEIIEKKSSVILAVIDNGPGIPAELRSRVFERFFRILGNKSPGSGLGLAIVQQIASLHQAEVSLGEPKDGHGLVIEIEFPKS